MTSAEEYQKAVQEARNANIPTIKPDYAPGSTMRDLGFETEAEYLEAQGKGATYGPHQGRLVPKNNIALIQGGQVVARFTPEQITKRKIDIPEERTRISVQTYRGTEKLLTTSQAQKLADLSGMAQFNEAKKLGLIPKESRYIGGDAGKWKYQLPGGKTKTTKIDTAKPKIVGVATTKPQLPAELVDITPTISKKKSAEQQSAIKTVFRMLTPWNEEAGETYLKYMQGWSGRVKESFKQSTRSTATPESQASLKAEYEANKSAPMWAKALMPKTVGLRNGEYYRITTTEAPGAGKKTAVVDTAKRIVINAKNIDWDDVLSRIRSGKAQTPADIAKAKLTNYQKIDEAAAISKVETAIREAQSASRAVHAERMTASSMQALNKQLAQDIALEYARGIRLPKKIATLKTTIARPSPAVTLKPVFTATEVKMLTQVVPMTTVQRIEAMQVQAATAKTSPATKAALKTLQKQMEALQNQIQESISTRVDTASRIAESIQTATKAKNAVKTQTATREAVKQAIETTTDKAIKADLRKLTAVLTKRPIATPREANTVESGENKAPWVFLPPKPLPKGAGDKEKRAYIKSGVPSVTFRMGELSGGRDVWHVFTATNHLVLTGKRPVGAVEVDGPGSALKTLKNIAKTPLSERITRRIGFMQVQITPGTRAKELTARFRPLSRPGPGKITGKGKLFPIPKS